MKIGIPRALLYHYYGKLWTDFFDNLGVEYIISPPTNKATIKRGLNNSVDEGCFSSKIYIGHVDFLRGICDMVFVPRMENTGIKEEYCTRLFGIYDLVTNTFPDLKLLHANVNYLNRKKEENMFFELGEQLGKTPEETKSAYSNALAKFDERHAQKIAEQEKLLNGDKLKVLIVSHAYNTFDAEIGENVIKFFKKAGVEVIFADVVDLKAARAKAKETYKRIYWKVSMEMLGGLAFYKDRVDGIVLISTFPCMPDSIINELIIRTTKDKPVLSLMIDELDASAGLITRLESFCDILEAKRGK